MDETERKWRRDMRRERLREAGLVLVVIGILAAALWWMCQNLRS